MNDKVKYVVENKFKHSSDAEIISAVTKSVEKMINRKVDMSTKKV